MLIVDVATLYAQSVVICLPLFRNSRGEREPGLQPDYSRGAKLAPAWERLYAVMPSLQLSLFWTVRDLNILSMRTPTVIGPCGDSHSIG